MKWEALIIFAILMSLGTAQAQSKIRISGISFNDTGSSPEEESTTSIDVTQQQCSSGSGISSEPFSPTLAGFTIINDSEITARLLSFRYEISRVGNTTRYRSPKIALTGSFEVPAKSSKTLTGLLFNTSNGSKTLPRTGAAISNVGFRTIRFEVSGKQGSRAITLKGSTTVSFDNFNRCSE